jgi:2-dehydro-3-deoxyphosphogluconate aldolase/(4S)-4-hydroxy-2-oxoglutarate aldolase
MNRDEVCRRIEEVGIVPIVRVPTATLALRAVDALLAGGVPVLEITLTVPDAIDLLRSLVARLGPRPQSGRPGDRPPDVLVGAGTVLDAASAAACAEAGASFIVSPGFDPAVIAAAHARGLAALPGALTPTEVMNAAAAGADMIKIFPCSAVGGAKYLRALRGPFPHVKLVPTGGITPATAHEYFAAGAVAVGMGSELVDVAALERGDETSVAERAREVVAAVRSARARRA